MGQGTIPDISDVMAALLAADADQPRNQPEIAANIGVQLEHMALESMSISVQRRIRDVLSRFKPDRIAEVGSGIGHLSAWLMDLWNRTDSPQKYYLIEGGGKFSIILNRLIQRYDASSWAIVKVSNWEQLAGEANAWQLANSALSSSDETSVLLNEMPLELPLDCVIIDVGWRNQVACIRASLPLLRKGGLLLTVEPEVPTGDVDEGDVHGQELVDTFQNWMELVKELTSKFDCAFQPLYGGTIFALIKGKMQPL